MFEIMDKDKGSGEEIELSEGQKKKKNTSKKERKDSLKINK